MAKRGRKPNLPRRGLAVELHGRGLSLAEIGRRMRISKQRAQVLLRSAGVNTGEIVPTVVRCYQCGEPVGGRPVAVRNNGRVPCLPCLADMPRAPFGLRLKVHRIASGLSQGELAEQSGVAAACIARYEQQRAVPDWRRIGKLVRALGTGLIVVEESP